MTSSATRALQEVLQSKQPDDYLAAQNQALRIFRTEYSQLLNTAKTHSDAEMRSEALHLVMLLSEPDHRMILDHARKHDPEHSVREQAEGLLFQSIVAERAMASGQLTGDRLTTYLRSVRRQLAEHRFAVKNSKSKVEPGASTNGCPVALLGNSGVTEGPPSVS